MIRALAWVGPLVVIVWHAMILTQYPVVGAANNLDFWRVMGPAGIEHIENVDHVHHRFVAQHYRPVAANLGDGFSSAALVAWLAKALTPGDRHLDIRQVGLLHLAIVLVVLGAALALGAQPWICILLLWAGLDVSWSLYFNSFFADSTALAGLVAIALLCLARGSALAKWRRVGLDVGLVVVAALIGLSKQLYMVTPVVVAAALLIARTGTWKSHLLRQAPAVLALLITGGVCVWHFSTGSGYRFDAINRHHMVFYGVVTAADDPAEALADLGVPVGHTRLLDRHFFQLSPRERDASQTAVEGLGPWSMVRVVMHHPVLILRTLERLRAPMAVTTTMDPNFQEGGGGTPEQRYTGWWQFAGFRAALLQEAHRGIPVIIILLVALAWLGRAVITGACKPEHATSGVLLLLVAAFSFGSVVGDGFFSLERHLMGARCALDMLLALLLAVTLGSLVRRWRGISAGVEPPVKAG